MSESIIFRFCQALTIAWVLYVLYSILDFLVMLFHYLFPPQHQEQLMEIVTRWA